MVEYRGVTKVSMSDDQKFVKLMTKIQKMHLCGKITI